MCRALELLGKPVRHVAPDTFRATDPVSHPFLRVSSPIESHMITGIRRPRAKGAKAVIKQEVLSPKADQAKRKYDSLITSDNEIIDADEVSIDGSLQSNSKSTKGGKGKQAKASGSKGNSEAAGVRTRKSSRLNLGNDNPSKKAQVDTPMGSSTTGQLFHRLITELAVIRRTCEDLAESFES